MPKCAILMLAAGKGTRMRSSLPKVLHPLAGSSMVTHVLSATASLNPAATVAVIAPGMEQVQQMVNKTTPNAEFAIQTEQRGTGHAVKVGMEKLISFNGTVLVVYGDTPLLTTKTLSALLQAKQEQKATIALLGINLLDPTGYGRLVMKQEPFVERIVECKDASETEKKIPWGWGGVMAFDAAFLREALTQLTPSKITGEYYLTELIAMATAQKHRTLMVPVGMEEAMGVNSKSELANAEAVMQTRLRHQAMENGVTLIDPKTVFFAADTQIAADVVIHPYVVFGPKVVIESSVEIRSFSHIEGAHIKSGGIVGPFARLRPGTVMEENAHVGNFVELKATTLGRGAKANHLSYVGDASVGANANIGAGTITCNYDGYTKHKTEIGEGAFIGSNSSLVAPVSIGFGAIVGAGSVITENVPDDALAIERATQTNKEGAAKKMNEKRAKK